jgi:hypothetical protein
MTNTLSPLERRVDWILQQYHEDGIFPTDDGLFLISMDEGHYDIRDVELDLLKTALDDPNHPYHHIVTPKRN